MNNSLFPFNVDNMYKFFNKKYITQEKSMKFKDWIKFMVYKITGYLVYKTSINLNMIVLTSFVDSAWENTFDGTIELSSKRIFFKFLMLCKDKENILENTENESNTGPSNNHTDNDGDDTGNNNSVSRSVFGSIISEILNSSSNSNDFESGQFIIRRPSRDGVIEEKEEIQNTNLQKDIDNNSILQNLFNLLKVYNKESSFPIKTYFVIIIEGDYFYENQDIFHQYNIKNTYVGNARNFSKWWNKIMYSVK